MRTSYRMMLVSVCLALASLVGAADASAAKLSIEAKPRTYPAKNAAVIGKLTPDPGASAAGQEIRLFEKRYPYRRTSSSLTTTTDQRGRYRFRVHPEFNTRYRAVVVGAATPVRSKSKLLVVFARGSFTFKATNDGRAAAFFRFLFSPKVPVKLGGRKVLWYFHRIGTKRFTVRDRTRSKERRRGLVVGRTRFALPRGEYRFEVAYCLVGPDRRDVGVGSPTKRRGCPRSFPARRARVSRAGSGATAGAPDAALGLSTVSLPSRATR